MKKIAKIMICTVCAMLTVSCVKSSDEPIIEMSGNEGVLALNIDFGTKAVTDADPDDNFTMRIYRYSTDTDGEPAKGLVRKYTALADVPQYIWLMKGSYSISVEVGDKEEASFEKRFFTGDKDFEIVPQKIETVDLECKMQNIQVAASFASSVVSKFTNGYYAYVSAIDEFDLAAAESGSIPTLKYESDRTGYFMLPENCTSLCWYFCGTDDEDNTVTQSGKIADVQPQTLYTLKFAYSKDAGGNLTVSATVDISVDHREDNIPFNPDPVVKGDGFDAAAPYDYTGGERTYIITALDNISEMTLTTPDAAINLLAEVSAGITVEQINGKEYHVTLSYEFFNTLAGGTQEITFRIKDASGGIGIFTATYGIQGANAIASQDYDLWNNTADFSATVFGSPANSEIAYRETGGEWLKFAASTTGTANTFKASATGFAAGKTYEYALFIGGVITGKVMTVATPAGAQIPNSGFEEWMMNGNVWCAFSSLSNAYWGSGNDASAGLLGKDSNLTVPSDEVRPGSTGTKSAYMKSIKASIFGIGKFAAGNLFVGAFGEIKGTNGLVDFGQPFTFTARPKALRFWMKNNCGTINEGNKFSGTDLNKIFVCLCDWEKPYRVDTSDESTLFDPVNAAGVLAYGVRESFESIGDWTLIEIPITYKDTAKVPNYLVLTYTCSGYGDYFCGSTDSWMYVDDVELVY